MGELATKQNLMFANKAPFTLANGWEYFLGSDSLGRSVLARLVVASRTTLFVAVPAVAVALVVGSLWGVWAGYHRGWRENVSMRIADVIMSFPSLLLAVVVLYVFSPAREHRADPGPDPHPDLPAHRPRRIGRTAEPHLRRRRTDLRCQAQRHHRPARHPGGHCRRC